jgi:Fur family peroxide stress response transcriptional regulator
MIIEAEMQKYRQMGLKLTPQRLAIIEYLEGNREHPSAEKIFETVRRQYPMMSFATVYNTLELLKQKGFVQELTIDPERRRYDPDTSRHHHLICTGCRKIVDIFGDFPVDLPEGNDGAFEVTGNHIEFYGICPECKERRRRNGSI